MKQILETMAESASQICQIITCALLLIRPVREWLMGTEALREGQRCLLRSEIVKIYYRNIQMKQLPEYELRNLVKCYESYKALKGNSFVDHLYAQMEAWEVI